MKRDRFFAEGLACDVYWDETRREPPRGLGMYLYGFPGSIGENEVTQILLKLGLSVVQPQYPGTYDSSGSFTPLVSMGIFRTVATTLRAGKAMSVKSGKVLNLPLGPSVCIAHSFGCFPALRAAVDLLDLRVLALLGPAIAYGQDESGCGLLEDGVEHVAYVKRARPFTFRLGPMEEWMDLYAGRLDFGEQRPGPSLKRIVGVVGEEDPYFRHDVLRARFEFLIRHHLGDAPVVYLSKVPGATHGPKGLLQETEIAEISSCLD